MVVAVAGAEVEKVWMIGGIADHEITRADIDQAHIEQQQPPFAGYGATLDDRAIAAGERAGLDSDVVKELLIDNQVWRGQKRHP